MAMEWQIGHWMQNKKRVGYNRIFESSLLINLEFDSYSSTAATMEQQEWKLEWTIDSERGLFFYIILS